MATQVRETASRIDPSIVLIAGSLGAPHIPCTSVAVFVVFLGGCFGCLFLCSFVCLVVCFCVRLFAWLFVEKKESKTEMTSVQEHKAKG